MPKKALDRKEKHIHKVESPKQKQTYREVNVGNTLIHNCFSLNSVLLLIKYRIEECCNTVIIKQILQKRAIFLVN